MEITKNDLSHNRAEVDFEALCSSVAFAFIKTRDELNRELKGFYDLKYDKDQHSLVFETGTWLDANRIKNLGAQLATITETAHTLYEARKREKFIIVNKPKVEHEEE